MHHKHAFMIVAIVLASIAAGCASVGVVPSADSMKETATVLAVGESPYLARWVEPDGPSRALVVMQHGFSRECRHLRGTAQRLARSGMLVLCIEASMAFGNPALAESVADALVDGVLAPADVPLPERIVVGGHSAGAVFASRVGWRLVQRVPGRLAGALLLDPVATGAFEANLLAIADGARRPVVAITANPGPCNAQQNSLPALRRLAASNARAGGEGFVGLQLTQGSTHVDAEGEDTDWAAVAACGQGPPTAANADALRLLAASWSTSMARGGDVATALGAEPAARRLVREGLALPIGPGQRPAP